MLGKLSLDAIPFHEPIVMVTVSGIILGGIAVIIALTYFKLWGRYGVTGLPQLTTNVSVLCTSF